MTDLATLLRARVSVAARLCQVSAQRTLAATPDDDRGKVIERYEATLLALWALLRKGAITPGDYRQRVQDAFAAAVGSVPADVRAQLAQLEQQALKQAIAITRLDDASEEDVPPSAVQRTSWVKQAAGIVWAAMALTMVAREPKESIWEWRSEEDPAVCEDCDTLDGQQFTRDEIPFYPAQGDFGENTACGPNCRCRLKKVLSI